MLRTPQTASATNADQRLSQLIRLKQLERPDAAFWEGFEQEFHSRQLTTFVQIQPMHTRLRRVCMIIARKAAPPVAAAGAVAVTFLAVTNTSFLTDAPTAKSEAMPQMATTDKKEAQDAYFVVSETEKAATSEKSISSDTIYQINALNAPGRSTNSYQLNATPVTFSQSAAAGQTSGVNVLRTQADY